MCVHIGYVSTLNSCSIPNPRQFQIRLKLHDIKCKTYFMKKSSKLSKLSQSRLSINPLRILDSKEEEDQEIIKNAPLFSSFLNKASIEHFEKV